MIRAQSNLVEEYTYVSRFDDALDRDAPDFEHRWREYLDGAGEVPLKEGGKPTIFHLRHLRAREANELFRGDANAYSFCRAALVGVSGEPLPGFKLRLVGKEGAKVANIDEAPDALYAVFHEVGGRVIERMTPSGK